MIVNLFIISIRLVIFNLIFCSTIVSTYAQQTKKMTTLKTSGYAPVNGLKMYYEIHGEDDIPLVLLHGGGSTIESSFGNILPLFAKNRKVIAIELQAHGRTSDRDAPETFEQDADDAVSLLKYLKVEKANFFGFSNGGTTTLQIAIRHPEIANRIVVAAGAYQREGFITGFFEGMAGATLDNMPTPLKADFLKVTPSEAGLLNMFTKDANRMINFPDFPDSDLASIKAKALIMAGDKDVVTPEHSIKMSRMIPGAELVILPGIHGVMIGEVCTAREDSKQPEITATLVDEFLRE